MHSNYSTCFISDDGKVEDWEEDDIRDKDWVEDPLVR